MNKETLQTNNARLETNNTDLNTILETINNLPSASGGGSAVAYQPRRISFADTYFESDYDMSAEITGLDTSNVEWFDFSFSYVNGVPRLDLSSFNTSRCSNFNNMFTGSPFEYLDLSNFTFETCFEACNMFAECWALTTLVLGEGWLGMTSSMLEDMGFGSGGGGFGGVIIPLLQGTPIENGEGYVYVPDELVDQFKEHEVFMQYADQILPKSQLA